MPANGEQNQTEFNLSAAAKSKRARLTYPG
jgi:hypothetical protein